MKFKIYSEHDDQRKEIIHGTIVITSVICIVIILAGVGTYAWFTWSNLTLINYSEITNFVSFTGECELKQKNYWMN